MSSADTNAPVLPEQFGPYKIVRPLGKGGMGAVYLARDTRLDRDVALKVCTLADNPLAMERFRREAKAAANLSHQNLCPVYEFDVRDGIAYLTMAFIEGPTLSAWVATRGGLSQREAARLVAKLALAMQVAHDAGVVHRDLKPSNIIINQKVEPVILDFGLARQLDDARTRLTLEGAVYGTPSYMAPEQAGGDPSAIGPPCDVYSLGVILYELLAGRVPFEGSFTAVMGQLLTTPPKAVRSHNAGVDPALEAICLKALEKKPQDRPRSMKEFARALAKLVPAIFTGAGVPVAQTQPKTAATGSTTPEAPDLPAPPRAAATGNKGLRSSTDEVVPLPAPDREVVELTPGWPSSTAPPPLPAAAPPIQPGRHGGNPALRRRRLGRTDDHEPDGGNTVAWIVGSVVVALVVLAVVAALVIALKKDKGELSDSESRNDDDDSRSRIALAADRVQSKNNLKQIGIALHNYLSTNNTFPPAVITSLGAGNRPPYSWRVALLPYLEADDVYRAWNFDEPYDGPNNRKLWSRMPACYRLPGPNGEATRTHYQVFTGERTAFQIGKGRQVGDFKDGLSNTIFAVETKDSVLWCAPQDIAFNQSPNGVDPKELGGHFGRIVNVLLGDGSVLAVPHSMSAVDFQNAIIIDDGNIVVFPP
jgi:serine/threonine protein kinase